MNLMTIEEKLDFKHTLHKFICVHVSANLHCLKSEHILILYIVHVYLKPPHNFNIWIISFKLYFVQNDVSYLPTTNSMKTRN